MTAERTSQGPRETLTLGQTNAKYGIKLTKEEHHALRFVSRRERRAFLIARRAAK